MSQLIIKKFYLFGKNKLFNINRSLTGKGNFKTLKLLKKEFPNFKIKSFKSNSKVFDWKVPKEWNVKNAYVIDKFGKKIIDFKENFLHLVGYSHPVKNNLKKKQLLKILYTNKKLKNSIPYMTSYYKKNSAFCVSYNFKKYINKKYNTNDSFYVFIDSHFKKNGKMHYGEILLKGKSKEEILISTYICHPNMANNETSGIILAMSLIKYFQKKKLEKSIRFIFVPENIGSIAYISKNLQKIKKNMIGGFILSCVGDEKNYSFKPTRMENTFVDEALKSAFKYFKIVPKKYPFIDAGSDERRFNFPGVDLPMALISRTKFGEYKEYHTSFDDFSLVTLKGLIGSFKITVKAVEILSKKIIPKRKNICEPFLEKRKLFLPKLFHKIVDFLAYSDGKNDLDSISKKIKTDKKTTLYLFKLLKEKNLVN